MRTNTKGILLLVLITSILVSGCASQKEPVSPENVLVTAPPVVIKEYQEQSIAVSVENNDTQAIDSVKVSAFDPLSVTGSSAINIQGKVKDKTTKSIY